MKKLTIFLCCLPFILHAQEPCSGSYSEYILNSNHIRASFYPHGNKFTDGTRGKFLVPYPESKSLSTIFSSSPWLGAFDDIGNLRLAVETYPKYLIDYSVGPLSPIGLPIDSSCEVFDRAWSVYSEDILRHMSDYYEDFKIDDTILSIFTWPGRGNKFFEYYYGFTLPNDTHGLAPFHDANANNIYDPENGDYPDPMPHSTNSPIPDQMLWMVFNDVDTNQVTGHNPLRFEIQLTAYAFHCQDNELLNNTIFNSYKIISRSLFPLDSTFFGMWTDYDLGCAIDDFIGCDSTRSTEFVYNADSVDGDVSNNCSAGDATYPGIPPVQSLTYLSQPMHSFISQRFEGNPPPISWYRLLNGQWMDGRAIRPDSDGYNADISLSPTKFLFNGDPRDSSSWAANNVFEKSKDERSVSSVYLGRLDPGETRIIDMAYMFHYDSQGGYLDQITKMYTDVDSLFTILGSQGYSCTPFPYCDDNDCVWPGDFNHNGIADQFDLLEWGVMKDAVGSQRNGLVSWRGHYAENWNASLPEGINFKHGDGNGNGTIDTNDLDNNLEHFLFTNPLYIPQNVYPIGPQIVLTSDTMDSSGRIRHFSISAGTNIENVLGLAYDIEYDTTLFRIDVLRNQWPSDSNFLGFSTSGYTKFSSSSLTKDFRYACVQTDHTGIMIYSNSVFQSTLFNGFYLKPGLTIEDIPDSTIFRLKNLIAIDPEGNDLHIGSKPLVVHKNLITGISNPKEESISIYPNPARSLLYIDVQYEVSGRIVNVNGQTIKFYSITPGTPLDVSGLSPGVYFLKMDAISEAYRFLVY